MICRENQRPADDKLLPLIAGNCSEIQMQSLRTFITNSHAEIGPKDETNEDRQLFEDVKTGLEYNTLHHENNLQCVCEAD